MRPTNPEPKSNIVLGSGTAAMSSESYEMMSLATIEMVRRCVIENGSPRATNGAVQTTASAENDPGPQKVPRLDKGVPIPNSALLVSKKLSTWRLLGFNPSVPPMEVVKPPPETAIAALEKSVSVISTNKVPPPVELVTFTFNRSRRLTESEFPPQGLEVPIVVTISKFVVVKVEFISPGNQLTSPAPLSVTTCAGVSTTVRVSSVNSVTRILNPVA